MTTNNFIFAVTDEEGHHAVEALDQAAASLQKAGFKGRAYQHVDNVARRIERALNGMGQPAQPETLPFMVCMPGENLVVARMLHAEDAAALVAVFGEGATIKARLRTRTGGAAPLVVWRQGKEEFSAADSYDRVAETIAKRIEENGGLG